ncbi:hypothetical protein BH20ACT3_BH20ACT3_10870 [soil metagenome]
MPTTHPARRVAVLAVAAIFTLVAAGCGSSGDDEAAETADTSEATTAPDAPEDDGATGTTDPGDTTDPTDDPTAESTETTDSTEPSGDVGERQDYVDAISASITEQDLVPPDQGDCLGEGWVDTIGFDRIVDAGITPEQFGGGSGDQLAALELGEPEAQALYDQLGDCDIDLRQVFLDLFDASGELNDDQRQCVDDQLTDERLRASFVADCLGEDDAEDPLEATTECFEG